MNIDKLRGRMVENRMTIPEISKLMNLSKTSLYKKMHKPDLLTIGDIIKLKSILNLTDEEAVDIFLT